MDTEINVRTCCMKRVYSVYTFFYKVYKIEGEGRIGGLGKFIREVGQVGTLWTPVVSFLRPANI